MPLDEREQRILAEIERQFYEEDPQLAKAVRDITRSRPRLGPKMAAVGLVAGAALMLLTFTQASWVAVIGFVVMVVSATAMVQAIRLRRQNSDRGQPDAPSEGWFSRFRRKWPFRRS
jgi:Protein of unknown function (DUF3040)